VALVPPAPSSPGSCAPKASHNIPKPSFAEETRICGGAATAGGCGSGQICAPKAFAPYDMCVYRPGDGPCPSVGYTKKAVVYDGATDTRACSQCSCGNATSTCKGKVEFSSQCNGGVYLSSVLGCGAPAVNLAPGQYGTYTPAPSGSCPPSSPTLSGGVTGTGQATVCCLP
jgi:hypothetical protein